MTRQKSPLARFMGQTPADGDELEQLRRRAWTQQGVLMICPSDPRLTKEEREFLYMIAESRYGYGGAK